MNACNFISGKMNLRDDLLHVEDRQGVDEKILLRFDSHFQRVMRRLF